MNATVGDLQGNAERMLALVDQAREQQADLVAFPELALAGYPPEDLLFKRQFLLDARTHLERIAEAAHGITIVVGVPEFVDGEPFHLGAALYPDQMEGRIYNGAAVLHEGSVAAIYRKILLPNHGVFDEERYFARGNECPVFEIHGVQTGINVCEDIWYDTGPATVQRLAGAEVVLTINGSPYHQGRYAQRSAMLSRRASEHGCFIAYVNLIGGQDELVFDGQSLVFDPSGELIARAPQFEESLLLVDVDADEVGSPDPEGPLSRPGLDTIGEPRRYFLSGAGDATPREPLAPSVADELHPLTEVYNALVTGTRDYVLKSGFRGAVIGLSGGIDSALTTAIAADALGPERVTTFFMPSQYTSGQSWDDSKALTDNLGVRLVSLPIRPIFDEFLETLADEFAGREPDTTEENLQARIRGNLLMAASNKFGWIVLTTGNKSEMATGYATLYGDMAGGFAVIKDVPKTLVQQLARHTQREWRGGGIPESSRVDRRPPSSARPEGRRLPCPHLRRRTHIIQAIRQDDRSFDEMLAPGCPGTVELTAPRRP